MEQKSSGSTAPTITTYQYPEKTGMWHYHIVVDGNVFVNDGGFESREAAEAAAKSLMEE